MKAMDLLRTVLQEETCLVGIGNRLRADDGFGPYVVESLKKERILPEADLMVVEDVPENFAFPISKKKTKNIVFIDAVFMDALPGTVIFGSLAELEDVSQIASTHKLSLRLTARVIEETGKKVFLLGIVPFSTEFGKPLSKEIKKIADDIVGLIKEFSQNFSGSKNI